MPRLSIVIPCLGETRQFENTLASVLQNRPGDIEILVVHNESYSDPYQLGQEVCFIHAPEANSVAALLNAGFEATRSAVVHVLQAGLEVCENWAEGPLSHFDDDQVGIVSPIIVHAQTPDRVLAAGWNFTSAGRCYLSSAGMAVHSQEKLVSSDFMSPTSAAGFYRRSLWRFVRWDTSICDEFAPLALAMAARELGFDAKLATECVITSEKRTLPAGDVPFGYQQAVSVERLFWRNNPTASMGTIAWHGSLMLIEFLAALPSPRAITGLLGRFSGYRTRDIQAYQAKIATAQSRMHEQASTLPYTPKLKAGFEKSERTQRKAA